MKYQPNSLEEINFHYRIVQELKSYIVNREFPHLLFYGAPGSGKTTIATCFSKTYLKENFKQNFLELNASNDRGINTIRNEVVNFVTHKPFNRNLKIMLLDEADYLTQDAQAALRRILEKNYNISRFILTCNHLNKIQPPIRSRCKIFKFQTLSKIDITKIIENLVRIYSIKLEPEKIDNLIKNSSGDIRYVINNLRSENIQDVNYIKQILQKYFKDLENNILNQESVNLLTQKFIDTRHLIEQTFNCVWNSSIDKLKKIKSIQAICEFQENILQGCNIKSQFIKLSNKIKLIYNNQI
jgi:replication factor C small subunit